MHDRRARFLLAAIVAVFGLGFLWTGHASANCPPDYPDCMGGGGNTTAPPDTTPPATSPPQTSAPVQQGSSSPPQTSSPATNPPTRTYVTRRPSRPAYTPPVQPAAQNIADTSAANVTPSPAIALSGTLPPAGGGVAAASTKPPATPTSSGAGTVLWAFGIGIGAVGIALGARATLIGAAAPPPPPLTT